jgi:hypothetical protein
MLSPQLQAERSHVLKSIVFELGGLAHDHMSLDELDAVIDSMLSKGVPNSISQDLTRWIHRHRKNPKTKISQILGTVMSDKHSLVPDCFGRFFDKNAVVCKACLDRVQCGNKCRHKPSDEVPMPMERVQQVYPVSKSADVDDITEILSNKTGQIAKTLAHGNKVVLVVSHNKLRVLTVDSPDTSQEDNMAKVKPDTKGKKHVEEEEEDEVPVTKTVKKGKAVPAPEPEEDEDEDLDLEDVDEEEESEDEEEEESPKSKKVAKAEPKKAEKPAKKEKKAPAPLNKLQTEFVDKLKTDYKDNDALFKMAKKAGVKWERKEDPRIDRMLCVMAVKMFLGEQKTAKK